MRASRVEPIASLQEFFKDSIAQAMERQGLEADDHTSYYVVNLLTLFARSDALYERTQHGIGIKPLATMLAEATEAGSAELRNVTLQRVGDVSLFVAGFFAESLAKRLVDLDYYIYVGGSAYGSLSEGVQGTVRGRLYGAVFAELAAKFQDFVDVLNDVRDEAQTSKNRDVLRLYEIWLRTRSRRAARLLRGLGIEPNSGLSPDATH